MSTKTIALTGSLPGGFFKSPYLDGRPAQSAYIKALKVSPTNIANMDSDRHYASYIAQKIAHIDDLANSASGLEDNFYQAYEDHLVDYIKEQSQTADNLHLRTGMAQGADTIWALAALKCQQDGLNVTLNAYCPMTEVEQFNRPGWKNTWNSQTRTWDNNPNRDLYKQILERSDTTEIASRSSKVSNPLVNAYLNAAQSSKWLQMQRDAQKESQFFDKRRINQELADTDYHAQLETKRADMERLIGIELAKNTIPGYEMIKNEAGASQETIQANAQHNRETFHRFMNDLMETRIGDVETDSQQPTKLQNSKRVQDLLLMRSGTDDPQKAMLWNNTNVSNAFLNIRNDLMVDGCDKLVACHSGSGHGSGGTFNTITRSAVKYNVPVDFANPMDVQAKLADRFEARGIAIEKPKELSDYQTKLKEKGLTFNEWKPLTEINNDVPQQEETKQAPNQQVEQTDVAPMPEKGKGDPDIMRELAKRNRLKRQKAHQEKREAKKPQADLDMEP